MKSKPLPPRRILTFFAHPDDEVLAAGATLSKYSRLGTEVHVAIPATGIQSRRRTLDEVTMNDNLNKLRIHCKEALSVVGVSSENITFGHFQDNEMDAHTLLEVVHWLENLIEKIKPEIIFTHHRYCANIDHQYCHEAAIIATRPMVTSHIPIICGEIPGSISYLKPAQWEPNLYIEVSEEDVEKKTKAMDLYLTEARVDPHPRSKEVLKSLAKVRGSEGGYFFAEAFMIQRLFA